MSEKPILFNSEMVRAVLDNRKTQTRRVIKGEPKVVHWNPVVFGGSEGWADKHGREIKCPYGKIGDTLWVRETFAIETNLSVQEVDYDPPFDDGRPIRWDKDEGFEGVWEQCHYKATDKPPDLAYNGDSRPNCKLCEEGEPHAHWKPSIHMPRWASRITLEITDIRVERVQSISKNDAKAEGITVPESVIEAVKHARSEFDVVDWSYEGEFAQLWDDINGKRGFGWDVNPWVFVIEFKKVTK